MSVALVATEGADGILHIAFDQSATEESLVYDVPADKQLIVVAYYATMDAAGTFSIEDESDETHSGLLDVGALGVTAYRGTVQNPVFTLDRGKNLQIQTTGGAASGWIKVALI